MKMLRGTKFTAEKSTGQVCVCHLPNRAIYIHESAISGDRIGCPELDNQIP